MNRHEGPDAGRLLEVWGDTVDSRHLAWSVAIGAAVSLGACLVAGALLAGSSVAPELQRAYAMLAGLAGCVLSGAICARLFPPKRLVAESGEPADGADRERVLDELEAQYGDLGSFAELPQAVREEMQALRIDQLFLVRERAAAARAPQGTGR